MVVQRPLQRVYFVVQLTSGHLFWLYYCSSDNSFQVQNNLIGPCLACRALIVNIGDLLERWTNCVFRSTLHRVVSVGKERYSVAFFLDPNYDTVVRCIESCCSEADPPRFPPIRSGEYITGRINSTYK